MQIKTETKVGIFVFVALGIFVLMLFNLRVFRIHVRNYQHYDVFFDNVSGLSEKSDVKIAGVRVGWVDKVSLLRADQGANARVRIMIKSNYQLHQDAYASIRQEGLLGPRYVEVAPGDPSQAVISGGSTLVCTGVCGTSVDTLLCQAKRLSDNLVAISGSFNQAIGGNVQAEKLQNLVDNLVRASGKIAAVAESLEHIVGGNEQQLSQTVKDLCIFAREAKEALPQMRAEIASVTQRLDRDVLPAFKQTADKITQMFDGDLGKIAEQLVRTAGKVEAAVDQAKTGIESIASVSSKIDSGQGLLGKLVNDEEICSDLKAATCGLRKNLAVFNNLAVDVDVHTESLFRPVDCYPHRNNLGYFNLRFYTSPSWFYAMQLVKSEKGWPDRFTERLAYYNEHCKQINPNTIVIDDGAVKVAPNVDHVRVRRNDMRIDVQAGKTFNNFTVRVGTFERSFGFGLDYRLPIDVSYFKWITSLEMYDFNGQNRLSCERRPHLKWLNRVYVGNLYFTFGGDDLVSRCCKNGFYGVGLRFSDDDLKHVASKLGFLGMGS